MHSVMLPRNPLPATFPLLLDVFRSSQRIHRLIELNLVAGANFALGWIRKWQPRLNYSSMSLSYPLGGANLRVHLESTLQAARQIIARLLQEDSVFFREFHYLDPLGVDDSDNLMFVICMWNARAYLFRDYMSEIFLKAYLYDSCVYRISSLKDL
jgi:hypothetical protein